jgi:creatinine amidohydrolase
VGDPYAATAAKGARYAAEAAARIGAFLIDLDAADPDDLYEGPPPPRSGAVT